MPEGLLCETNSPLDYLSNRLGAGDGGGGSALIRKKVTGPLIFKRPGPQTRVLAPARQW